MLNDLWLVALEAKLRVSDVKSTVCVPSPCGYGT